MWSERFNMLHGFRYLQSSADWVQVLGFGMLILESCAHSYRPRSNYPCAGLSAVCVTAG